MGPLLTVHVEVELRFERVGRLGYAVRAWGLVAAHIHSQTREDETGIWADRQGGRRREKGGERRREEEEERCVEGRWAAPYLHERPVSPSASPSPPRTK